VNGTMRQDNLLTKFLSYHIVALTLFFSWCFPFTNLFWQKIDAVCAESLHNFLIEKPFTQAFWALANIRLCDLFGAVFMICFSLLWACDANACKSEKKIRLFQCLYVLIWFELGILTLKEFLFPFVINTYFLRDSPSLVMQLPCLLSETIPWLKVKVSSHWSFPSDHAFIILQWATFMYVFAGKKIGALAYLSSIFFILPRLFSGAHWISDIFAGSLPLALIIVSWARYTPIYELVFNRSAKKAPQKNTSPIRP